MQRENAGRGVHPLREALSGWHFWTGIRYYRRPLNLHQRPVFQQRRDDQQRHRRIVAADYLAVDAADVAAGGEVGGLVGDVPGQADEVLRSGSGLLEDGYDVFQSLTDLLGEVVVSNWQVAGFQPTWPATKT